MDLGVLLQVVDGSPDLLRALIASRATVTGASPDIRFMIAGDDASLNRGR